MPVAASIASIGSTGAKSSGPRPRAPFRANETRSSGFAGSIKNETPKNGLRRRAWEPRFPRQIPHTETKPHPRNAAVLRRFERHSPVRRRREIFLRLKKNLAGESQSAIVHCRPLLAIAAVASVAHRQKMPANSASLACWPVLPPRRDRSCAYKIGVSRLVQCPVSAYSMYSRSAVEADCVAFSIALPGASGHRKLYSWLSKSLHVLTTLSRVVAAVAEGLSNRGCGASSLPSIALKTPGL